MSSQVNPAPLRHVTGRRHQGSEHVNCVAAVNEPSLSPPGDIFSSEIQTDSENVVGQVCRRLLCLDLGEAFGQRGVQESV